MCVSALAMCAPSVRLMDILPAQRITASILTAVPAVIAVRIIIMKLWGMCLRIHMAMDMSIAMKSMSTALIAAVVRRMRRTKGIAMSMETSAAAGTTTAMSTKTIAMSMATSVAADTTTAMSTKDIAMSMATSAAADMTTAMSMKGIAMSMAMSAAADMTTAMSMKGIAMSMATSVAADTTTAMSMVTAMITMFLDIRTIASAKSVIPMRNIATFAAKA